MKLRGALVQINPTVRDLVGNTELIVDTSKSARAQDANLIVFSEMIVTGYQVEDIARGPSIQAPSQPPHVNMSGEVTLKQRLPGY
jgi:NAD+ synthase (glutamine-hydrolysing)